MVAVVGCWLDNLFRLDFHFFAQRLSIDTLIVMIDGVVQHQPEDTSSTSHLQVHNSLLVLEFLSFQSGTINRSSEFFDLNDII